MTSPIPDSSDFTVTFWGVRGTMPVTDPAFAKVGGNTSCVEVNCGTKRLILDAGTGIVNLGKTLEIGSEPIDILLSHTHIDHILGLLFFEPIYNQDAHIRVFAGHLLPETNLKHTLNKVMSPPIFPVTISEVSSTLETVDFQAGTTISDDIDLGEGVTVTTTKLYHPDRATGYRIGYNGKSVCYITDIEHSPDELDTPLLDFIHGTDYLIYDSTFDDAEFQQYQGWGHSTWQHAIRLAEAADVRRLALYHHHHQVNDIDLENREKKLNNSRLLIDISHDNMSISI